MLVYRIEHSESGFGQLYEMHPEIDPWYYLFHDHDVPAIHNCYNDFVSKNKGNEHQIYFGATSKDFIKGIIKDFDTLYVVDHLHKHGFIGVVYESTSENHVILPDNQVAFLKPKAKKVSQQSLLEFFLGE